MRRTEFLRRYQCIMRGDDSGRAEDARPYEVLLADAIGLTDDEAESSRISNSTEASLRFALDVAPDEHVYDAARRVVHQRDDARRERDAALERVRVLEANYKQQTDFYWPIREALGCLDSEATVDAALRVVRERDEARAARNADCDADSWPALVEEARSLLDAPNGEGLLDAVRRVTQERNAARLARKRADRDLAEERASCAVHARAVQAQVEAHAAATAQARRERDAARERVRMLEVDCELQGSTLARWTADMRRIANAVAGREVTWGSPEKGGWDYGTILGQIDEMRRERDEAIALLEKAAESEAEWLNAAWEATGVASATRGLTTLDNVIRAQREKLDEAHRERDEAIDAVERARQSGAEHGVESGRRAERERIAVAIESRKDIAPGIGAAMAAFVRAVGK